MTIESEADDVSVRIMQGDQVVKKMTVTKGAESVRIAVGQYVVEVDGGYEGITANSLVVSLERGKTEIVRITRDDGKAVTIIEHVSGNQGRSPFPTGAHVGGNDSSVMVKHDDVDLHYVLYYAGSFDTSSSGFHNDQTGEWRDRGSVLLKDGTSFGYEREPIYPDHLRINGKDFDLRQGRVIELEDGNKMQQCKLFPSRQDALQPARVAELVAQSHSMNAQPVIVKKLRYQLGVGQAQLADLLKTHAETHPLVEKVKQSNSELQSQISSGEKSEAEKASDTNDTANQIQVVFHLPPNTKAVPATSSDEKTAYPSRVNLAADKTHHFTFLGMPGEQGIRLSGSIELLPLNPKARSYLAHNSIPIQITSADIDQCNSSNFVEKAIYLPISDYRSSVLGGIKTMVSTLADPIPDLIGEARRRGELFAVLRLRKNVSNEKTAHVETDGSDQYRTAEEFPAPVDAHGSHNSGVCTH
ncbi:MAG: hypothetical protein WKF77_24925 [Planctomycetaceae bacterium]